MVSKWSLKTVRSRGVKPSSFIRLMCWGNFRMNCSIALKRKMLT